MTIGSEIEKRLVVIDEQLPELEKGLDALEVKVKAMRAEKRDLHRALNALRGGVRPNPAVTNDQIVEAVKEMHEATNNRHSAADIAEHLGVTTKNVSRKIWKLVQDGLLDAYDDDGVAVYSVAQVTA